MIYSSERSKRTRKPNANEKHSMNIFFRKSKIMDDDIVRSEFPAIRMECESAPCTMENNSEVDFLQGNLVANSLNVLLR